MGFFVRRPVFAAVIALVIALVGLLAVRELAVEQYPNVAPPQVQVTATYPGASPELLENVVAAPLEREMNGVSGLLYMQSTSSSSGLMQLQVVFEPGTDLDIATVEVNNRVKRVEPLLPQVVLQNGVRVDKTNPSILAIVTMRSTPCILQYVSATRPGPLMAREGQAPPPPGRRRPRRWPPARWPETPPPRTRGRRRPGGHGGRGTRRRGSVGRP